MGEGIWLWIPVTWNIPHGCLFPYRLVALETSREVSVMLFYSFFVYVYEKLNGLFFSYLFPMYPYGIEKV